MSSGQTSATKVIVGAMVGLIFAAGALFGIRHYKALNDNRTHRGEEWNNGDFYFGNDLVCLQLPPTDGSVQTYRFNVTVIPHPLAGDKPATLFYQRRDAGVGFRLILVEANPIDENGKVELGNAELGAVELGATIASGPGKFWSSRSTLDLPRGAKLFHGQPDPSDASHFTIRFDAKDPKGSGLIDAWLTRENTVRFATRSK
jgi:hypothetical protein